MPKSKRSKIVNLTKTQPKQKAIKEKTMAKLEANFTKFNNIYILELQNLNGENQKALANNLPGILIFGKKTVLRVFFTKQLENYPKLEALIEVLVDPTIKDVCILLTNSPSSKISETFNVLSIPEFAQPGSIATATIILSAGNQVFESISTANEGYLRNLGLFTTVKNGKLFLEENFVACEKGKQVSIVQAKILKMLGIKAGTFGVNCRAIYDKSLNATHINR